MTSAPIEYAADTGIPVAAAECPFPGLASYDYDHRDTFRGRNAEKSALASMILGRRLTVLTAASGDGKTSLIHAGIVPLLLYERVEVAVAEPGGNAPLADIGKQCLDRLVPDRRANSALVKRLIAQVGEDKTLEDARNYCQALSADKRQELLIDRRAAKPVDLLEGGALVSWLRDSKISNDYLASAMRSGARGSWPDTKAPLTEIFSFLADTKTSEDKNAAANFTTDDLDLSPDQAKERLIASMDRAVRQRRGTDEDFEFVLVLDQFEQIFVQFRDSPGKPAGGDRWQHRDATLAFVNDILRRRWPLHVVLSLRKEHYADLQSAFGDAEGLAGRTYHLGPLTTKLALECLLQPTQWPGARPTPQQAQVIVDALAVEDRYVHPALLSVVGEWLWRRPRDEPLTEETLRHAVPGAIDAFVRRAFGPSADGGHDWSELDKHEALDMFDQLIIRDGSQGRRNSVARSALLNLPLRNKGLRERLLRDLEKSRLVRGEERLGGQYIEIVHESLILVVQSIAAKLRNENQPLASLPLLLDELRTEARQPMTETRPLPNRLLPVLFNNIARIELPPVLAARVFGRLLLDPDLLEMERAVGKKIASEKDTAVMSVLRQVLCKLATDAARETGVTLGDPEWRIGEGYLVSPKEAETLLKESHCNPPDSSMLTLILGSALAHRDRGVATRIRSCAQLLRSG